jgi:hypothetical protein
MSHPPSARSSRRSCGAHPRTGRPGRSRRPADPRRCAAGTATRDPRPSARPSWRPSPRRRTGCPATVLESIPGVLVRAARSLHDAVKRHPVHHDHLPHLLSFRSRRRDPDAPRGACRDRGDSGLLLSSPIPEVYALVLFTLLRGRSQPVEKLVVGLVGGPREPEYKAKTLQKRRIWSPARAQKRPRRGFSTVHHGPCRATPKP